MLTYLRTSRSTRAASAMAAALMLLTLTGCRFGLSRRTDAPLPSTSLKISYGKGLDAEAPKVQKASKVGTLVIRLSDQRRNPIPGAYVTYRGPTRGKRPTDAKGVMKVTLPAGRYLVSLPPCGVTVMPQTDAPADVVVVPGRTAFGDLANVPWVRRFTPTPSVDLEKRPPWPRGETVALGVRIEDGCNFLEAPRASVAPYRWKASSNFAFRDFPSRAGRDGFARVSVRCLSRGNGSIVIYDPLFPQEKVDLLAAASGPNEGETWCE